MTDTIEATQALTSGTVAQFVAHFTRHQDDDTLWSVKDVREALTAELTRALDPVKSARAELEASGVTKHAIDSLYPTALQQLVQKVDNRPAGQRGYTTTRDEIMAILSEVSRLVPASVIQEPYSNDPEIDAKVVSVEIKFRLALERDLL